MHISFEHILVAKMEKLPHSKFFYSRSFNAKKNFIPGNDTSRLSSTCSQKSFEEHTPKLEARITASTCHRNNGVMTGSTDFATAVLLILSELQGKSANIALDIFKGYIGCGTQIFFIKATFDLGFPSLVYNML